MYRLKAISIINLSLLESGSPSLPFTKSPTPFSISETIFEFPNLHPLCFHQFCPGYPDYSGS